MPNPLYTYIYIKYIRFGLAWFYGTSFIVGYLMSNIFLYIYIKYMISKHILKIIFLNEPEVISFRTVKWFHLFQSNIDNSIIYQLFVCTQFIVFKYCITNHSIKHQSFNTQLNDQTVLFQTIQFSIGTQFKCRKVLFDP